jgi:hypothetical protein
MHNIPFKDMVVSTLTGTTVDPKEMADWSFENGYVAEGNGNYHALIPNGAQHFGLTVTGANDKAQTYCLRPTLCLLLCHIISVINDGNLFY